ncbi:MAG TPA: hypothetical protein VFB37_07170 [Steroidobacteraceae bacterium]|nr:hypothetical protein [Steroidobacteraceae bacterium]
MTVKVFYASEGKLVKAPDGQPGTIFDKLFASAEAARAAPFPEGAVSATFSDVGGSWYRKRDSAWEFHREDFDRLRAARDDAEQVARIRLHVRIPSELDEFLKTATDSSLKHCLFYNENAQRATYVAANRSEVVCYFVEPLKRVLADLVEMKLRRTDERIWQDTSAFRAIVDQVRRDHTGG